jgi:hypothetical protein
MTDAPKRRWLRFQLRTLFVVLTAFALVLGWWAYNRRAVHEAMYWLFHGDLGRPSTSIEIPEPQYHRPATH